MDITRVILLMILNVSFIQCEFKTNVYRVYSGSTHIQAMRSSLLRRVGSKHDHSVGLSCDPGTHDCSLLSNQWLVDKPTDDSMLYMENILSDQEYGPAKMLYRITSLEKNEFHQAVPVGVSNGSMVDVYFTPLNASTSFHLVFRKGIDYLLRVTVRFDLGTILFTAKFNGIWSSSMTYPMLQYTANKKEKLSFCTTTIGFEIYHNDVWISNYNNALSPHKSFDFERVTIWMADGSYMYLHRIVYNK